MGGLTSLYRGDNTGGILSRDTVSIKGLYGGLVMGGIHWNVQGMGTRGRVSSVATDGDRKSVV